MNRSMLIVAGVVLTGVAVPVVAQERVWIRQFGTVGDEEAKALTADGSGGFYVAGDTNGMMTGTRMGLPDPWLARYQADGTRLWIRQFGGTWPESAFAWALAPDGAGGVYISGEVNGTIVSPPVRHGGYDAWIARFNDAGDRLWIRQIGTFFHEGMWALASDGEGGVFAGGDTQGDLGGSSAGTWDVWLARYAEDGSRTWIKQFGTESVDYLGTITADGAGGFFACGATFGDLAGPHHFGADAWLGRFDANGDELWMIQFGVSTDDWAWCMSPDGAGGVFVGGWTRGALGTKHFGERVAWVGRFDGDGNPLWLRQIGTSTTDETFAVTADGEGGVFATGRTWGALGSLHTGESDVWVARFDAGGAQVSLSQFGSGALDRVHAMMPDGRGGVMLAGSTDGRFGATTGGARDAWVGRFGCYADCDQSTGVGVLDIFDFLCFGSDFAAGGVYACNCNASAGYDICDILDFLCFGNAFANGCP